MNIDEFKTVIDHINNSSWSFGNETLYSMAKTPGDITDKDKLTGAIWLIGRAYAASPQRRAYGKTKNKKFIDHPQGDDVTRPIWPVKTSNDGRGGFFDFIAERIAKRIDKTPDLHDLIKTYSNAVVYEFNQANEKSKNKYISDNDFDLLCQSIRAVLQFNRALSDALEEFDNVPQNNKFDGDIVHCNSHISFCSKFLHFYFPNIIFIIDSYAYNGGSRLYKTNKGWRYICDPQNFRSEEELEADKKASALDTTVDKEFDKEMVDSIAQAIKEKILNTHSSEDDSNSKEKYDDDDIGANNYIWHCARSYLLGKFIKDKMIVPSVQIKGNDSFRPIPRLTDAVLLNIKKERTKNEKKLFLCFKKTFYNNEAASALKK